MNRIQARLAALRSDKRKALILYVTAGDPSPTDTVPLLHAMVDAGADIIELGIPFSDPMADGPVIQAACERALKHGTSLMQVLTMVQQFREQDSSTPIILMGYLNPIEVMGYSEFTQAAANTGVDGVLTVDMPPEESTALVEVLNTAAIDPIFLLAPTSDAKRIRLICDTAKGFVYYVSLKGVTGASSFNINDVQHKVQQIREFSELPIGVGFGIKDASSAAQVAKFADAVVVGSALVKLIAEYAGRDTQLHTQVSRFVRKLRDAIDQTVQSGQVA